MADLDLDKVAGVILGTAIADALGLPREGLSPRRARRLFGSQPLGHRFVLGRGLMSDDGEHTCMVAQALLQAPDDAKRFARTLAWKFRWWLLGLPLGVGRATLKGICKLWLGFSPASSGVWSAGNGPAMRAAILGICLGQDRDKLADYVRASSRLTHTDPRAEKGAFLVALAAYWAAQAGASSVTAADFFRMVRESPLAPDAELQELLRQMEEHCRAGFPASQLVETLRLERGVTGYIYHTVPLAVYCWLRSPGDFRAAVEAVIMLGGDADTTAAITGALVGATVGASGIPREWLAGLLEWPRSVNWMRKLAPRLRERFGKAPSTEVRPLSLFWPGLVPRNLFFLLVVFVHVFRRLLPPY